VVGAAALVQGTPGFDRMTTELRFREAARVVVIDEADRVLLVLFQLRDGGSVWATTGGGLEPGETHEEAARRELREEAGLDVDELGPCIWIREHRFDSPIDFDGQRERYYLVRTSRFAPRHSWAQLNAEGVADVRWWTIHEIDVAMDENFAPRRLGSLLRELLDHGPPAEPLDVGV
jgi:8-oxo-dGTP diphosphatase